LLLDDKSKTIELYAENFLQGNLDFDILGHRARGHIKGKIINADLNAKLTKEKEKNSKLQKELKECKEDVIKAINQLKEQDRTIAGMEAQIFYLKKE